MTPRFCPSIEFLYTEYDAHEDRVERAAAQGAAAVEMWGWQNKNLSSLRATLERTGLHIAAMVIDPLVGVLADPNDFRDALDRTVDAARQIGCRNIIVISGARGELTFGAGQHELTERLDAAAGRIAGSGVGLALEALNTNDHPLTHLRHLGDAVDVARRVGSPGLGVVVDLWHTSIMGDAVAEIVEGNEHLVRHVQLARFPDRSEPVGDDLPNGSAVAALIAAGYGGALGFEYRPTCPSEDSYYMSASYWKGRLA